MALAVMKRRKSVLHQRDDQGREVCWTTGPVKIGALYMVTHSSKGQKLTVTRVKYTPLSMPK